MCLIDISEGVPTETIRKRWANGVYGKPGERPRGEYVAGWLAIDGRKQERAE